MTAILNGIRDAVLPEADKKERREAIAGLEIVKLALRAMAAVAVIFTVTHPPISIGLLAFAYLTLEGSMVAANLQTVLEDFSVELSLHFSEHAFQKNLFQNAPLCRSVYKILNSLHD